MLQRLAKARVYNTGLPCSHASSLYRHPALSRQPRNVANVFARSNKLETVTLDCKDEQIVVQQSAAASSPSSDVLSKEEEDSNRMEVYKLIGVGTLVSVVAALTQHEWVMDHQELSLALVFGIGYVGIIAEEVAGFNKAGVALLMATSLWIIRSTCGDSMIGEEVSAALSEVSSIIFFLLGAMTIVEVVDQFQGFDVVTRAIQTRSKSSLLWLVALTTFFLSSILDNLTTTIVMVSLLDKLCPDDADTRNLLGGVVVIAANAGGAWTPIGDVTTTMLWIHGYLTTWPTMRDLLLPSAAALLVPVAGLALTRPEFQGQLTQRKKASLPTGEEMGISPFPTVLPAPTVRAPLVLSVGLASLVSVPLFTSATQLPPYMGILTGLGVLWLLTDALHYGESRRYPTVSQAIKRVDTEGVLFFLGILMAVSCLDAAGLLRQLAGYLGEHIPSTDVTALLIGGVSAVVDNVPLVAATMGMYDVTQFPVDSNTWQLIAYCAGTGGSMLVIGSAAGVAYMGASGVSFSWYAKNITPWAAAGYLAGVGVYEVLHMGGV